MVETDTECNSCEAVEEWDWYIYKVHHEFIGWYWLQKVGDVWQHHPGSLAMIGIERIQVSASWPQYISGAQQHIDIYKIHLKCSQDSIQRSGFNAHSVMTF